MLVQKMTNICGAGGGGGGDGGCGGWSVVSGCGLGDKMQFPGEEIIFMKFSEHFKHN